MKKHLSKRQTVAEFFTTQSLKRLRTTEPTDGSEYTVQQGGRSSGNTVFHLFRLASEDTLWVVVACLH